MTLKGRGHYPNVIRAQNLENDWRCYLATIAADRQYDRLSYRQLGFLFQMSLVTELQRNLNKLCCFNVYAAVSSWCYCLFVKCLKPNLESLDLTIDRSYFSCILCV